ncbi:MAG: 4-hydroxythreonine-4-phosphate dehydrogenase PdxA [Spirochaetaceae bacterium]|nr:MAG: 4-hydroxythreonine-4-phosphate dehydrogenase PdxA [Spirochaetaceae bacterium]
MKPIIGITIGDPAGIGPEITAHALQSPEVYDACIPLVIGDADVMRQACSFVKVTPEIRTVSSPEEATGKAGVIEVLDLDNIEIGNLKMGTVQAPCGAAAYEYIEKAVHLANEGRIHAMATGPINKESLRAAKVEYIGHTEILGALTGTSDPLTLFQVDKMRIFFLTRHVSLRKAIDLIRKERILDYLSRCTEALNQLGVERKDIAVAGLNPHCGEHGLFGDEDDTEIRPAVEAAQAAGLDVTGPIGADSIFHMAVEGRFAAVLSLYHDQGHIAAKTYDFYRTVSVTLGMPILRTSVDHGTAFDVAGTGKADSAGMKEAILAAAQYAPSFAKRAG